MAETGQGGGMQSEAIRDKLLKVDALGQVRVSAERREALLDAL